MFAEGHYVGHLTHVVIAGHMLIQFYILFLFNLIFFYLFNLLLLCLYQTESNTSHYTIIIILL